MEKEIITLEVELKTLDDKDLKKGDYIKFEGEIYRFDGYEWGTYPIATNVKTGEQRELPHY